MDGKGAVDEIQVGVPAQDPELNVRAMVARVNLEKFLPIVLPHKITHHANSFFPSHGNLLPGPVFSLQDAFTGNIGQGKENLDFVNGCLTGVEKCPDARQATFRGVGVTQQMDVFQRLLTVC